MSITNETVTADFVKKALAGMQYPATAQSVAKALKDKNAPEPVVETFTTNRALQYSQAEDVVRALKERKLLK
ncbi:DUF2795 domain-containing protein [Nonomuraea sp. NPDC049152]|uniref:DUF2795 domain-containing protein n=1 Tax=Nonomuraea sp. NPDC049152 TaxID=3154350 RepID=UPI0033E4D6D9